MPTGPLAPVAHYLRTFVAPDAEDGQLLARFLGGDEAAFAALVKRHGPMVLSVCRRVLRDWHGAEDAFQATFLVLARRAASLARPEALGPWLHGVAYRTAIRARADAARRRAHEREVVPPLAVEPSDDLVWRDLRPVLDEAIDGLPQKYRVPVVLCYLEGKTNTEAAHLLGCSRGTVATRLARARERLRRQLTRRGLCLPGAALAALLSQGKGSATVPAALAASASRAATLLAAGGAVTGVVSAKAAVLAEGVVTGMVLNKLKVGAALLLGAVLVAGGTVMVARPGTAPKPPDVRRGSGPPSLSRDGALAGADRGNATGVWKALSVLAEDEKPLAPQAEGGGQLPSPRNPPANAKGATYCSPNFLVEAPTPRIARLIGEAAERSRKEQALLWLGKEMPAWPQPCPLRVTVTMNGPGGTTSFCFERGRILRQDMHIEGTLDQLLATELPHEVTHTIFAHHFGRPLPRWADEGGAVLAEGEQERRHYEGLLLKALANGRAMPLRRLLTLTQYPQDVVMLFAQGYSVTSFLVGRGDRPQFLAFVAQGMRGDWDRAVRDHYGYGSVEELERAWLAHVRVGQAEEPAPQVGTGGPGRASEEQAQRGYEGLRREQARLQDQVAALRRQLRQLQEDLRVKQRDLQELRQALQAHEQELRRAKSREYSGPDDHGDKQPEEKEGRR